MFVFSVASWGYDFKIVSYIHTFQFLVISIHKDDIHFTLLVIDSQRFLKMII